MITRIFSNLQKNKKREAPFAIIIIPFFHRKQKEEESQQQSQTRSIIS